jgi:hypothetical protein
MVSRGASPQPADGTLKQQGAAAAEAPAAPPPPRRHLLRRFLFFLGLASLCYVLGAAVMFFELPSSSFLRRAFVGGAAWYELRGAAQHPTEEVPLTVGKIDKPGKTCDGFTLCMYGSGSRAVLINMRGEVVHQWQVSFSRLWTDPPHLRGRIDDASVYFNDAYLYPNGDLLVLLEGPATVRNPSNGYGLVKLDKDSRVLWTYARNTHHDLDVAEDGTIYALTNEVVQAVPKGLEFIPTPCMVDCVDVVSREGKKQKTISLLEALHDSPYAPLFSVLERPTMFVEGPPGARMAAFSDDLRRRDVLHANAVKVLSRRLAPKFPLFKAGQLLTCLRHLDALAVVDPDSGKAVWAARGPWAAQHDPTFLDNGRLLLFDNLGSPRGSRVLEYDPKSQAFPWTYPGASGTPFSSRIRGLAQRLPNGNTLIVNSVGGEVFEVTPGQEVVWSCSCGAVTVYRARRYLPEQLPFLSGDKRARP